MNTRTNIDNIQYALAHGEEVTLKGDEWARILGDALDAVMYREYMTKFEGE